MGDARGWSSEEYKAAVLAERYVRARTVYGIQFAPGRDSPQFLATATSDGNVGIHAISRSPHILDIADSPNDLAKPALELVPHNGPVYGLLSFGEFENGMLASCGDDGRIALWRWNDLFNAIEDADKLQLSNREQPIMELRIPQRRAQYDALLPVPEANSIAVDLLAGQLFCAAGDGCAYAWDMETGQNSMVFRGHSDYLQCIVSRPSHKQIITGSEDGTARIWDCRSGRCSAVLDPWNAVPILRKASDKLPWVSCMAIDASENWMACGSGTGCITLWNLSMVTSATRIATSGSPQAVAFTKDEIVMVGSQPHITRFNFGGKVLAQVACAPLSSFCVAVHPSGVTAIGGYAGMVDVISNFGSHLCAFCC